MELKVPSSQILTNKVAPNHQKHKQSCFQKQTMPQVLTFSHPPTPLSHTLFQPITALHFSTLTHGWSSVCFLIFFSEALMFFFVFCFFFPSVPSLPSSSPLFLLWLHLTIFCSTHSSFCSAPTTQTKKLSVLHLLPVSNLLDL